MQGLLKLLDSNPSSYGPFAYFCQKTSEKWNGLYHCDHMYTRVRPRFFDQVGHQTTNAYIGNKHLFTK